MCLNVDEAVLVAAVARAIVGTCRDDVLAGGDAPDLRPELVRAAMWRAARWGLTGSLIDLDTRTERPAREAVGATLGRLAPSLERTGDLTLVRELTETVLGRGNGAQRQRAAFERRGAMADVVAMLGEDTGV